MNSTHSQLPHSTAFWQPLPLVWLRWGSLILAAIFFSFGFLQAGIWQAGFAVGSMLFLWGLFSETRWGWIPALLFPLSVLFAAAGLFIGVAPLWSALSVVAALSSWDLEHFARRLAQADHIPSRDALVRRHIQRLLVLDAIGLGLYSAALAAQVRIGFGAAILLGLLAVSALSPVIRYLQRRQE